VRCDRCSKRAELRRLGLTLFNGAFQPSDCPDGALVADLCGPCIEEVVHAVNALLDGSDADDGEC
jgi:hypothetical protein